MIPAMRTRLLLGLGLGLSLSCATSPPVEADRLALKRVVIYRNGVAYFEREGHVSEDRVSFRVRGDEVGDFLASFAVMERNGSSVRAASFPLRREEEAAPVPEKKSEAGSQSKDPKKRLETVVMELDGHDHDLAVGYIAESPVWRPSYRLVLQNERVHLQVWGIVQNQSGEDWRDTHLTVVADAPLSLRTQLETPLIPDRPLLAEGNEVMAVVPQSETSLQNAPPPPPASVAAMAPEEDAPMELAEGIESAKAGAKKDMDKESKRGLMRHAPAIPRPQAMMAPAAPSRTRNLAALAAVAVTGGATRYELPNPVTVPNGSATMLLLLDKEVPGESAFLFAPDPGVPDSASHPFRVASFTNQTGGLLERGPLAFFGEGGFLGQGVIDNLPQGASATVPFALERSLAVERNVEYIQEGSRLYQVDSGRLTISRQVGPRTKYTIKSGSDRVSKLWLKHPRQAGSTLLSPRAGTEDNLGTGSALIPFRVEAKQTATLELNERSNQPQGVDWLSPLAEQAVKEYLAAEDANPATTKDLKAAFVLRDDWKRATDEAGKLRAEQQELERATEETRGNLKAIEKNKAAEDLRKTLTSRLSRSSARLDVVTKRLIELDLQTKELELRFREAVKDIKIPARG